MSSDRSTARWHAGTQVSVDEPDRARTERIGPQRLFGLAGFVASPPVLHADPGVGGCVDVVGVSACSSVDVNVPNINAVTNAIPNVPVPNINVPNVNINPGYVGLPGRGR